MCSNYSFWTGINTVATQDSYYSKWDSPPPLDKVNYPLNSSAYLVVI